MERQAGCHQEASRTDSARPPSQGAPTASATPRGQPQAPAPPADAVVTGHRVISLADDGDAPQITADDGDGSVAGSDTSDCVEPLARPTLVSQWRNRATPDLVCAPGVPLFHSPYATPVPTGLFLPWGVVVRGYRTTDPDKADWIMFDHDGERMWACARPPASSGVHHQVLFDPKPTIKQTLQNTPSRQYHLRLQRRQ